jgi:uncharacterized ferritin-like protein (DUF455 family)
MPADLISRAHHCLMIADVDSKLAAVALLHDEWQSGAVPWQEGVHGASAEAAISPPGRPPLPQLVEPRHVPARSPATLAGRAALLHAIAHIEFTAINLALDHLCRFREMPKKYFGDWLSVAADEARHFRMLAAHLSGLGYGYGDFPAHYGLWQMAEKTAHDALARMALIPRTLEARGLDATPEIQKKLEMAGDFQAARLLDTILADEIGHVALGDRWFRYLCAQRGLAPELTYLDLLEEYAAPRVRAPLNVAARLAAGFSAGELELLVQRTDRNSD